VASFTLFHRRAVAAIVVVAGALSVVSVAVGIGRVSLFPPGPRHVQFSSGTATAHILVDVPTPSLLYRRVDIDSFTERGEVLGRVLASPPGLALLARHSGVPLSQLSGIARTVADVPRPVKEPGLEQRADQIVGSRAAYRIEVQVRPYTPVIDVFAQAPTGVEAVRLADAAVPALDDYVRDLARRQGASPSPLTFKELGPARGGTVNSHATLIVGAMTLFVAFPLFCALGFGLLWLRVRRRPGESPAPWERPAVPAPTDNWPHTNRLMPWMIAAFIGMLWLVPFNQTKLNASLPIDLQLDRLFLPVLVATWVFALAIGGRAATRARLTWIHAALAVFVLSAFASVLFDAPYLAHILELGLAVKQVPLLLTYVSLFVIVSTVVRPAEVRPYLKFSLVLAVICGLGMIYEYRAKSNIFYTLTGKALPGGAFTVQSANDLAVDSLGRREVHGPAEPGVEAVTMLAMALPIAIVGFMHAKERRSRILYCVAAGVLVAAMFATSRKSALVVPASVGLTIAYFRRRELLKLAPFGAVLAVVVTILAPGMMHATLDQFLRSDASSVPTTSDRTSDYDAIRPDLWSHLAFGRGWGTYNHESYRILDSEVLHRLVDVGVFGLLAFVGVGAAVVLSARRTIRERDPRWAPSALIGACTAVAFLCASALYDALSFPHGTYIFLYVAALVAVVVGRPPEPEPPPDPWLVDAHMPASRQLTVAAGVAGAD
jgi:hypothetical protein